MPSRLGGVSTLRELAAESIGRITRRGLESQLAHIEAALTAAERVLAVAPGRAGTAGIVVVITADRLLISSGEPFAQPSLETLARDAITSVSAAQHDDAWALHVDTADRATTVNGMFDRDAQRFAVLLAA
jgi:hypothetical protein